MLDLKPSVYELNFDQGAVYMLVDASSSGNIKPGAVMEALYREYGEELPQFARWKLPGSKPITEKQGEVPEFVPLREAGEDFS